MTDQELPEQTSGRDRMTIDHPVEILRLPDSQQDDEPPAEREGDTAEKRR